MSKFRPGDEVIVKKFSKEEYNEIYIKKYNHNSWDYEDYLIFQQEYFEKIYTIQVNVDENYWINETDIWFYEEELELAYTIKDQIEFVKEILLCD